MFHEKELKGVRKKKVVCMECALEHEFNKFLAEVLDGKHKELIADLRERLEAGEFEP